MSSQQEVADAFRMVAMRLEDAIERGRRPNQITAADLLETMLAIADRLDPPVAEQPESEPPVEILEPPY